MYEQYDGVAMGSPLGPLLANAFMCMIEEQLVSKSSFPKFYKRYVDDIVTIFSSKQSAEEFLQVLNNIHTSAKFTMEVQSKNTLPYIGVNLHHSGHSIETSVYRKPTNTGQLLHFNSCVDKNVQNGTCINNVN